MIPFLDPYQQKVKSNQVVTKETQNDITCKKIYDRDKQSNLTYFQVLLINVSNGDKTFRANALLDSSSDSMLFSKALADKLNFCDKLQTHINIY